MGGRPFTGVYSAVSGGNVSYLKMGRAISANYAVMSPKLRKFEILICRLKKMLGSEKKHLRQVKTLLAREIDQKNSLEKILR
jgi:hypothetical protein